MFRVVSIVFLLGTGSFALALLKNTTVFFVNLALDSLKFSKELRRITPSEAKEVIFREFLDRASWLPRHCKKLFYYRHHHTGEESPQNVNYSDFTVQRNI